MWWKKKLGNPKLRGVGIKLHMHGNWKIEIDSVKNTNHSLGSLRMKSRENNCTALKVILIRARTGCKYGESDVDLFFFMLRVFRKHLVCWCGFLTFWLDYGTTTQRNDSHHRNVGTISFSKMVKWKPIPGHIERNNLVPVLYFICYNMNLFDISTFETWVSLSLSCGSLFFYPVFSWKREIAKIYRYSIYHHLSNITYRMKSHPYQDCFVWEPWPLELRQNARSPNRWKFCAFPCWTIFNKPAFRGGQAIYHSTQTQPNWYTILDQMKNRP